MIAKSKVIKDEDEDEEDKLIEELEAAYILLTEKEKQEVEALMAEPD